MHIAVINQHTDNYGDDIAAYALTEIAATYSQSVKISFLYAAHPYVGLVPSAVEDTSHVRMERFSGVAWLDLVLLRLLGKRGVPFVRSTSLREQIRIVSDADLVVFSPCGANIGIYRDWNALKGLIAVCAIGRRPLFHLNTIGNSRSAVFNWLARWVLKRSSIGVREKEALDYLFSQGIGAYLGPDTAFALPPVCVTSPKVAGKLRIGIVPTKLDWHPDFRSDSAETRAIDCLTSALAEHTDASSFEVEIIPHTYGLLDEASAGSSLAQALIAKGFTQESIRIRSDIDSASDYDKAIANCDVIISMRYHGVVLAAKNCVPFVSIGYENKMSEVATYTGSLSRHEDIRRVTTDWIKQAFEGCLTNSGEIRISLANANACLGVSARGLLSSAVAFARPQAHRMDR